MKFRQIEVKIKLMLLSGLSDTLYVKAPGGDQGAMRCALLAVYCSLAYLVSPPSLPVYFPHTVFSQCCVDSCLEVVCVWVVMVTSLLQEDCYPPNLLPLSLLPCKISMGLEFKLCFVMIV